MATFLDDLLSAGSFDVIIAEIPSLGSIAGYGGRLGLLAEHHSERFNWASADLSARSVRTTFVGLSPATAEPYGRGRPTDNYRMYRLDCAFFPIVFFFP